MKWEMNVVTGELVEVPLTVEEQNILAATALLDAPDYKQLRLRAYPSIGDQLEAIMQWVRTQDGLDLPESLRGIAEKCAEVKQAYPKPHASV